MGGFQKQLELKKFKLFFLCIMHKEEGEENDKPRVVQSKQKEIMWINQSVLRAGNIERGSIWKSFQALWIFSIFYESKSAWGKSVFWQV